MGRLIFDTCIKLKESGLSQEMRPNDFYYITPRIVVRMDELSDLRNPWSKFSDFSFDDLVFQPNIEDLLEEVKVHQLVKTVDSGWMVYQDNIEGNSYRASGDTVWLAIANLFILIADERKKLFPEVDQETLDESNSKQL